jgi:hypothetical protein
MENFLDFMKTFMELGVPQIAGNFFDWQIMH